LRLKRDELVPAEEDRQFEVAIYDLLLPCRRFDIAYKVAVLGIATPTLEFLLRLVKTTPGISEEDVLRFFGFSRREVEYVLDEATAPGYVDRDEGRLWLTTAGEALFSPSDNDGPVIFSVEGRRGSYGFDLLAMAPDRPRHLDKVEMVLPDLKLEDHSATGRASQRKIPDSFRRFFRELGDRKDREQVKKRDLYSIDSVSAGERFQVPVRIRLLAQASNPSIAEIDFADWRPDHEVADRSEIERAAARFVEELTVAANPIDAKAYETLIDLAPEFLKEFTTKTGLSVNRYWREAVSRSGEVRSDRKTIPLIGGLTSQDNVEKFLRVIEYGHQQAAHIPRFVLSIPPLVPYWGATSVLRDTIAVVGRKLAGDEVPPDENEISAFCLVAGKPAKYVEHAFDRTEVIETMAHPPSLEFLVIPNVAACASVHAPIGSASGLAAPLGFASFDPEILKRVQALILDTAVRLVGDEPFRLRLEDGLAPAAANAS
jgi:hypothetical protein